MRAALLLLLASGFFAGCAPAQPLRSGDSEQSFGERSLYVLHIPILEFGPARILAPPRGTWGFDVETAYANTFSHSWHATTFQRVDHNVGNAFTANQADAVHASFPDDQVWFVDGELLRTTLTARYGLSSSWSLAVELPYISHGVDGGDRFIEQFHSAFGINQAGRADFPRGQFLVMLQRPGGEIFFEDRRPDSGVGDASATLSFRPRPLGAGLLAGGDVALKVPTGAARDFNGSGSVDGGLLFFVARPGEKWLFDAEAGIVFPGRWRAPGPLSTSPFARVFLAANRRFGARSRAGLSIVYEQSPFRGSRVGDVSRAGAEAAFGIEHDFSRALTTRLTLTEHVAALGDRADVGLALRLAYRP